LPDDFTQIHKIATGDEEMGETRGSAEIRKMRKVRKMREK
jgi:hypothetical protein